VFAILKPIRYVFYRILMWKLHDRTEQMPVLATAGVTTLLLFSNAILALMTFNDLSGRPPLPEVHRGLVEYVTGAILALAVAGVMNSAWVADGKFDQLQREFRVTTRTRENVRTVLFWGYIVFSAVTPFIYAILWPALHS
jgi:hypothetical protein